MTDGPLENVDPQFKELFMAYLELFRRRMAAHAMTNGYFGTELPERQLRDVVEQLTAQMRIDCGLTYKEHWALKGILMNMIFGTRTKQWVKQ